MAPDGDARPADDAPRDPARAQGARRATADRREIEATLGIGSGRRRGGWRLAAMAALAAGALGAAWLWGGARGPQASPYLTEPALRGPLTVTVIATGTVEPTNLVEVSSELSGTVREVLVDHNDTVAVGQALARLDTSKLDAQLAHGRASVAARTARVAEAEATLLEARVQYDRIAPLVARNVATQQSLDVATANLRRAEASLAVARADADVARADLTLDETNLAKACICSPIAGVVLERAVEVGQIVASSLQAPILFTLAEDLRQMELRVDVDEADMGRVAVGQKARFTVEAHQGRSFPAAITQLRYAPQTVDGVVTYEAVLGIDNADLALRPGMTATAEITVAHVDDALLVPNAALRFSPPVAQATPPSGGGLIGLIIPRRPGSSTPLTAPPRADPAGWRTIWVERAGAAEPVRLRIGASDGGRSEVLEGALAPGEAVITDMARP